MPSKKKSRKAVSYNIHVADRICDQLSAGVTLKEICQQLGMPTYTTVIRWARDDVSGFRSMFESAVAMKYVAWEDECIEIADDSTNDWVTRKVNGKKQRVADTEHIARSKTRIDTRLKLMAKRRPDLYSDRATVEHTGKGGGPIEVDKDMPLAERQRLVNFLLEDQSDETALSGAPNAAASAAELPSDGSPGSAG